MYAPRNLFRQSKQIALSHLQSSAKHPEVNTNTCTAHTLGWACLPSDFLLAGIAPSHAQFPWALDPICREAKCQSADMAVTCKPWSSARLRAVSGRSPPQLLHADLVFQASVTGRPRTSQPGRTGNLVRRWEQWVCALLWIPSLTLCVFSFSLHCDRRLDTTRRSWAASTPRLL